MPEQMKEVSLYDRLVQFFRQREWSFEPVPTKQAFRTGFTGTNGSYRCHARADDERRLVFFYTCLEGRAPQERRQAVSEFIARVNYRLSFGDFEMDFSDGEVRYKTVLALPGGQLSMEMIECLVLTNLQTFDRYYPGLMAVIWSDASPEEAIRRAEEPKKPGPGAQPQEPGSGGAP